MSQLDCSAANAVTCRFASTSTHLSNPLVQWYFSAVCKCACMHFLHIMEIRHESNCCRGTGSRERERQKLGHAPRGGYQQRQQLHTSAQQTTTRSSVEWHKNFTGDFFVVSPLLLFPCSTVRSLTGFPLIFMIKKTVTLLPWGGPREQTVRTSFSYTPSNQCATTVLRLQLGWVTWGKAINQLSFQTLGFHLSHLHPLFF